MGRIYKLNDSDYIDIHIMEKRKRENIVANYELPTTKLKAIS